MGSEFGWEIVWQGVARKIARKYDKIYVSSFPKSEALYSDFATFITHDITGPSCMTGMNGLSKAACVLPPWATDCDHINPQDYSLDKLAAVKSNNMGEYIIPEGSEMPAYDIVIHARERKDVDSYRNWSNKKWDALISYLKDYKICAIGTAAYCPPGVDDMRHTDLKETIGLIKNCKLVVGPSSGPMHLASLCAKNMVVWGESKPGLKIRYIKEWNFHDTPCVFSNKYSTDPAPKYIYKLIANEIN